MRSNWIKVFLPGVIVSTVLILAYTSLKPGSGNDEIMAEGCNSDDVESGDAGLSGCPYLASQVTRGEAAVPAKMESIRSAGDAIMFDINTGTCPHHQEGGASCCDRAEDMDSEECNDAGCAYLNPPERGPDESCSPDQVVCAP